MDSARKYPVVSIIVPCYNHACYLPDALQSVLDQTYPDWECIIVNDCSPDDTIAVATEWMVRDSRFKLVNAEQNEGLAASRNLGIQHSHGEYILPLDADDKIANVYLEKSLYTYKQFPQGKVVYTDVKEFDSSIENIKRPAFSIRALAMQNQFQCTALYTRNSFNQSEGYRTNMVFGYEDWDFWMQILNSDEDGVHIAEPLFFLRKRNESMVQDLTANAAKEQQMRKQLYLNNPTFFRKYNPVYANYMQDKLNNAKPNFLIKLKRKLLGQ